MATWYHIFNRMKILYLVPRYYPAAGGSENLVKTFAEGMHRAGHDVTVYTSNVLDIAGLWAWTKERNIVESRFEVINGVKVHRFPINVRFFFWSFFLTKAIRKVLQYFPFWQIQCLRGNIFSPDLFKETFFGKETFDVVHVTPVPFDSLFYCGYRIAKRNNAKLIATPAVHIGTADDPSYVREYSRQHTLKVLDRFDMLLTNTDIESEFLRKLLSHVDIKTLGLGIDVEKSRNGDGIKFRNEHAIPSDATVIFYVGTKSADKGVHHLIEAFDKVRRKLDTIYLVLAGNEFPDFKQFFNTFDKRNIIYFDGPVDDATKWDIFAGGDIMVYASRSDSFGIAILEAWANKKAVIGAWAGGIPGVIDDTVNGLMVQFGDVDDLAEKLIELSGNRDMREKLGNEGFQKLNDRFTEDKIFHRIIQLYSAQRPNETTKSQ